EELRPAFAADYFATLAADLAVELRPVALFGRVAALLAELAVAFDPQRLLALVAAQTARLADGHLTAILRHSATTFLTTIVKNSGCRTHCIPGAANQPCSVHTGVPLLSGALNQPASGLAGGLRIGTPFCLDGRLPSTASSGQKPPVDWGIIAN